MLDEVGLAHAADRRVGGFSLGMRQRLGLAGALLGRPGILLLDEPANGLDPEGIRWLRGFLRSYADEGNTVLISSHLLAEVQQTVDDVVIIARGRLRFQGSLDDLNARAGRTVEVRTAQAAELRGRLAALGIDAVRTGHDSLTVAGATAATVGEVAALGGIPLTAMTTDSADLEALFLELTAHDRNRDGRMTTTARMRGLLASEARKAASTPLTYGFLAAILAFTALNTSLSLSDDARQSTCATSSAPAATSCSSSSPSAPLGAAGEFRHGTAVPTFLATPARWRVVAAKLAAHLGLGAIVAVACVAVQMALALPWIDAHATGVTPWSAAVLEPAIGSILCGAAFCALGVAVGMLVRNQIVALAIAVGWFAVAEGALATFTPDVSRFLPGGLFSGADNPTANLLPLPIAAALLAAYVVGLSVLATRTTLRHDIA